VAHGLAKSLVEPMLPQAALEDESLPHGTHPLADRDEVHEIYAEWRQLFNQYTPPRTGVAEAWVQASRRARYASPEGLGQAFNFDLLEANWNAEEFRNIISDNLALAQESSGSSTWVLSNHDVVRHATRYGLPQGTKDDNQDGKAWLLTNGTDPPIDAELGIRRARAASLLMLALPGSAYLYQGEELGLHEVADLPDEEMQDPAFYRSGGVEKGRDGCRVPLPWKVEGSSFGFGDGGAHLPQPAWFGRYSVQAEETDPASTLRMYRQALSLRRTLQREPDLEWVDTGIATVLHFTRADGWQSVTNFGSSPVAMPVGNVVVASGPLDGDELPPDTTAWVLG
jgi:alpha-glucosidase